MHTPFDTSGTSLPTRVVRVDQIVDLLHVSHAQQQIAAFRQAMLDGSRFPPISVFRLGQKFVITDGHKRFSAALNLGLSEVDVELWTVRELTADLLAQISKVGNAVIRARSKRRLRELYRLHRRGLVVQPWDIVANARRSVASRSE